MKKVSSNLLKVVTLVALMVSCLYGTSIRVVPTSAQEVSLRLMIWTWTAELNEAMDNALAEFEESRGVVIQLIRVGPSLSYWGELTRQLESAEPPDVMWVHHDMVLPLIESGPLIIELNPLVEQWPEVIQGIPNNVLGRFQDEDHLYGIPLAIEGEFALHGYLISKMALEFGKADEAFELIVFLRSRIPPPAK